MTADALAARGSRIAHRRRTEEKSDPAAWVPSNRREGIAVGSAATEIHQCDKERLTTLFASNRSRKKTTVTLTADGYSPMVKVLPANSVAVVICDGLPLAAGATIFATAAPQGVVVFGYADCVADDRTPA